MVASTLLITENYREIEQARELGIKLPKPQQTMTKLLFRKSDVKKAIIDGDKMVLDFYDEESYSLEFDKELWGKLEEYFTDND